MDACKTPKAQENIKGHLLKRVGVCTRIRSKQYDIDTGISTMMVMVGDIEKMLKTMVEEQRADKRKATAINKELAKQNHALKKELSKLRERIGKMQSDLDTSQASLDAIFEDNFDSDAELFVTSTPNRQRQRGKHIS